MTPLAWEAIGVLVTIGAITGVVLNNHRRRACFLIWMVTNAASALIHLAAGMVALTCRDASFFALAIHGYIAWGRSKA